MSSALVILERDQHLRDVGVVLHLVLVFSIRGITIAQSVIGRLA
jgi:hypothetical protein